MTAKVISIPQGLSTPEKRAQWIKDTYGNAPKHVDIRTMQQALDWGDSWMRHARRLEAQLARMEMLAQMAQIHEKASELLREHAEAELQRVRGESVGDAGI